MINVRLVDRAVWQPGLYIWNDGTTNKPQFSVLGHEFERYEAAQATFVAIFNAMRISQKPLR